MDTNRISVIIPNYNRVDLIGTTIENMLSQSVSPYEIIVVDDGSTDCSVEVIRSFGKKVRLIEQSNQGPGAARNRGLEVASGEYIQFMDSDDLASLNKLEVQLAALKESQADFAYCPWIRSNIDGNRIQFSGPVMQGDALPNWKSMLEWQLGSWCLVFQNCLFRRKVLERAGKYRTDLMPTEDSEYLVRILINDAVPVYTPDCVVFYRADTQGQNQITSSGTKAEHRAQDRTRYLEIVGEQLAHRLSHFHRSTRRDVALDTYRHNRYCRKMGWDGVNLQSPFSQLAASMPPGYLSIYDFWERFNRKLLRIPPQTPCSKGLALRPVGNFEKLLAKKAGFEVKEYDI